MSLELIYRQFRILCPYVQIENTLQILVIFTYSVIIKKALLLLMKNKRMYWTHFQLGGNLNIIFYIHFQNLFVICEIFLKNIIIFANQCSEIKIMSSIILLNSEPKKVQHLLNNFWNCNFLICFKNIEIVLKCE